LICRRSSCLSLNLAAADRLAQQFRCAGKVELFFYTRAMSLDRLDADPQGLRYVARSKPLAEQIEDGQFAVAELLDRKAGAGRFSADELRRDRLCQGVAQVELALQNRSNCLAHVLGRLAFHDVTLGPGPQGALGVMGFLVHREHQHR